MSAVATMAVPATSHAQDARIEFDIAAQPLVSALGVFGQQAGRQVLFDEADVAGRHARAVKGSLTPRQALEQLLAGTGVAISSARAGGFTLRPALLPAPAVSPDAALPEVRVTARAEGGEPTEGTGSYTARISSAATGLDLPLRETPQSVTVVTRQRMEDEGLNSVGKVLDVTPGVALVRAGASGSPAVGEIFYARGFEITNYQIDGLPVNQLGLQAMAGTRSGIGGTSTALYDQVTVVRGATGLMNGAGNPAAAINLVRKRPTSELHGAVEASAGRWSRLDGLVDLSGPFDAAKTLRGRVVVGQGGGGEWMDRHRDARNGLFYGVLEADLAPTTLLTVGLEHTSSKDRGISFNNFMRVDTDGNPTHFWRTANASASWTHADVRRSNAFATLDHQFGGAWAARLSVNHTRLHHDQVFGFARGEIDAQTGASSFEYGKTVFTPSTTGLNFHLTGTYGLLGREHELMLGLNHETLKASDPSHEYRFDLPVDNIYEFARTGEIEAEPPQRNGVSHTRIRQTGGYLATRLRPMEGLALIAGARVSNYRLRDNWSGIDESGVVTPYLGVVADLGKQVSAYASYTTIFNPQSYQDRNGQTLSPEKGRNYEIGLKGEFLDGRLNASAAVFQTRKSNLALWDEGAVTPNGDDAYIAADKVRARGYELEVSGEPLRNWRLAAGFSRVVVRDSAGQRLLQEVPVRQLKLFTSYTLSGGLSDLTLGGGVTWQSRTSHPYDANPVLNQGSFAVFSLMARYRVNRHWTATLNVANLADKTYLSTIWYHNYGTPRDITATLRYEF
ncbi:TonB-dependent siderophore receptor [Piscinibacter sp.]|uniref:TonB-dependent siderophore receptor n=1 Tax=Piscinibacter sp. TaxID=1903157 RepID=UPI0039E22B96